MSKPDRRLDTRLFSRFSSRIVDEAAVSGYFGQLLFKTLRFTLNLKLDTKISATSIEKGGFHSIFDIALDASKENLQIISKNTIEAGENSCGGENIYKMILLFDFANFEFTFSNFLSNCVTVNEECQVPVILHIRSVHSDFEISYQTFKPCGFASSNSLNCLVTCRSFLIDYPNVNQFGFPYFQVNTELFSFNYDQCLYSCRFNNILATSNLIHWRYLCI